MGAGPCELHVKAWIGSPARYGSRPVDRYRINEQGKAGSAVGRNAGGRSGTLAPAANINDLRGRRVTGRALNAEDQVMVSGIVGQP